MNNWEHLSKFFMRKNIDIGFADYDGVIHFAPNAAFNLLVKLYGTLTGRKLDLSPASIQEQYLRDEEEGLPAYARQTIAGKMKDKEL